MRILLAQHCDCLLVDLSRLRPGPHFSASALIESLLTDNLVSIHHHHHHHLIIITSLSSPFITFILAPTVCSEALPSPSSLQPIVPNHLVASAPPLLPTASPPCSAPFLCDNSSTLHGLCHDSRRFHIDTLTLH